MMTNGMDSVFEKIHLEWRLCRAHGPDRKAGILQRASPKSKTPGLARKAAARGPSFSCVLSACTKTSRSPIAFDTHAGLPLPSTWYCDRGDRRVPASFFLHRPIRNADQSPSKRHAHIECTTARRIRFSRQQRQRRKHVI